MAQTLTDMDDGWLFLEIYLNAWNHLVFFSSNFYVNMMWCLVYLGLDCWVDSSDNLTGWLGRRDIVSTYWEYSVHFFRILFNSKNNQKTKEWAMVPLTDLAISHMYHCN